MCHSNLNLNDAEKLVLGEGAVSIFFSKKMAKISKSDCEGNIYDLDVQLYDLTQERIYLEQVDSGEATQRIIQIDRYYTDLLEDRKYWEDMLYSGEYENYEWTGSGNTEKDKRNSTPVSMPNDLYHTDQKATAVDLKTPVALDAPIEAPIHVSPTKVFKNPVFTDLRTPVSLGNIVHSSVGTSLEPPLVLSKGDSDLSSPASKQSLLHNNSPKHAFQIPATSDIYTPVSLGNDVPGSVASPLEPPWVPSKGGAVLSSPASTQFLLQNNAPKNLYYDSSKIQISNSSASNRDSQISFLSESSSHNQQNPLDMHQVYAVNNVIQPQKDNVQILRKTERKEQQKRGMTRKHWIMVIIVFLILALVAVVLSLLLTKKGNNDSVTGDTSNSPSSPKTTPSATKPPRPAPTSFSKAYSVTTLASNVQEPAGIRIDPLSGNLIVSEYTANIFLKITPSGSRSVFVGSGTAGLRDGSGRSSQFTNVTAFAINSIGTIYATGCQLIDLDFVNNVIRVITKDGDVSTILRNSVSNPSGICVDNQDNLYLADAGIYCFNYRKQ